MASLKAVSPRQIKDEVSRVAALVNLTDRLRERLSAYSGGMRQRILLAAAILGNPKLIILDEPTAGLDPQERIRTREIVKGLAENTIVLFATHVVSDIENIADEIILMKKGVVVEKAPPAALCQKLKASSLEEVYMRVYAEEQPTEGAME